MSVAPSSAASTSRRRFEGKVALITGAGRGQGRAHATRLASEGANLILCDIGDARPTSTPYDLSAASDLKTTASRARDLGARAITRAADVRSREQLDAVVADGIAEFGQIDVLLANAGIASISPIAEMSDVMWQEMIDINLGGVFKTMRAVVGHMVERGYGRIVATSSIVGRQGSPNIGHYVAAKWGVIGLVKSLAIEVAEHGVTVNALAPTSVDTLMIQNDAFWELFLPDKDEILHEEVVEAYRALNPIPEPWVAPADVSAAAAFLASDEARYITGEVVPVALGWNARNAS
ncbi:MAG TPA: mycofactocin-coupled SDR family oxidoreductase [Solirubrobacteraceae bacterium]|nr:mycofactocin-coupled SDR family oxidoreductase [Solirubrobacteraceae bacterium]